MSEHEDGDPGFRVTLKDVYSEVRSLRDVLDNRLRKIESQIAAQWVVVGIIIVGLGAMLARSFTLS